MNNISTYIMKRRTLIIYPLRNFPRGGAVLAKKPASIKERVEEVAK